MNFHTASSFSPTILLNFEFICLFDHTSCPVANKSILLIIIYYFYVTDGLVKQRKQSHKPISEVSSVHTAEISQNE